VPFGLFILLTLLQATPAVPAELTARQIAEKAREKDRDNLKRYGKTPCRLVEIKEELNEDGMVQEREERTVRVAFSSAPAPGGKEAQRISPEPENFNKEEDSSILDHLEMFDWTLETEDESQGERCYRLAFHPRRGGRAVGARHAVLSQSRGRCWVAKKDFSKIRLEGRLMKPLELMGFLVTVREVDFITTTKRVAQGIAAPAQVRYRFRVEVFPFFEFHERHTQIFEFSAMAQN